MTKKLKISIGPNRDQMVIAHVNNSAKPTIINSEYFVGRVLIKIRDFDGFTPDGSPPIRDHVYFDGRSRKFDIQIEGRFKRREGVPLYSGEEVHFGSDFDHIVDFPKSAFNAGMRVARWIDPNVFYDLSPPSERPFIMSPYLACMNTLCAWPSPARLADALVCLRQSDREDDPSPDGAGEDMVPMEQVDQAERGATAGKKKIGRHTRRYWRFIGLKGDGARIDAFLEKNKALLAQPPPEAEHEPRTEQAEDDDDDALSCRAPSSHATYATAIEGAADRPPLSSASSYRFSPRIFPRHQISLGAGMRDLYQDAEIEANEREGEARAQRMIDIMGEDDTMPSKAPLPVPPVMLETPQASPSHESDEVAKKSSKVKHSLKKLKTALRKITPSLSSSSLSAPQPQTVVSPKPKHYSTALQGKTRRETGSFQATVSRAASRKLPPSVQTLRNESRSAETVKAIERRSTLMSRPQSHQPPPRTPTDFQQALNKFRSTSLDQTRHRALAAPLAPLRQPSAQSSLQTIAQAAEEPEGNQRAPSPLSASGIGQEERLSSPSTYHSHSHSDETSETSTSPAGSERLRLQDSAAKHQSYVPASAEALELTVLLNGGPNSVLESEPGLSTSPLAMASESDTGTRSSTTSTATPLPSTPEHASDAPTREPQATLLTVHRPTQTLVSRPSQIEVDAAPELEDVEPGDLMFANMLKISAGSSKSDGEDGQLNVEDQLGAWRFKDPTTDILEDNTFVFLNKSVNVQKRRKYFSESNGKHRKSFTYDPDVVYATSFFSPFMDFNTFDLAIGPVKINVAKVFGDMPVRYTLRSTRIDQKFAAGGSSSGGKQEEEIFVTIAFELVDDEDD